MPCIALLTHCDKLVYHLIEYMSASFIVKFLSKTHPSIQVEVGVQAIFKLVVIHKADVDREIEFRTVSKSHLSHFKFVRKLFEHEVKEVAACVGLPCELLLKQVDAFKVEWAVPVDVVPCGYIHDELGHPLPPLLE